MTLFTYRDVREKANPEADRVVDMSAWQGFCRAAVVEKADSGRRTCQDGG
jgi:hypothetical protein